MEFIRDLQEIIITLLFLTDKYKLNWSKYTHLIITIAIAVANNQVTRSL